MIINWIKRQPLLAFCILLCIYYLPQIVMLQDAYYKIHDTLEDGSYNFKPLWESGQMFNFLPNSTLDYAMNGLPRSGMHSGLIVMVGLYAFLPAFWVHYVFFILVHFVAFVGMYLLLKNHFLKASNDIWIVCGVSFCFAIIPHFEILGLSSAGQPLLLYAFLNFQKKQQKWFDVAIILLFPFFSFFVRGGFALIFLVFCIGAYKLYQEKRINKGYTLMAILFAILYPLIEIQMFYGFFCHTFISYREEYRSARIINLTFYKAAISSIKTILWNTYHSGMSFMGLIISLFSVSIVQRKTEKLIILLTISIIFISVAFSFYPLIADAFFSIKIIRMFQFSYIAFLLSTFWMLLFALVLKQLQFRLPILLFVLLSELALISYSNKEWRANLQKIVFNNNEKEYPSHRSFYAETVFAEVASFIGKPQQSYRVVGLGLQPTVMQYNGFYTLDSYQNNYLLSYKHQFRKVIAKELAKDENQRKYFDYWGGRCQIFVANHPINQLKGKYYTGIVENLEIDTNELKKMGASYVLSAVIIKNPDLLNLKLLQTFENPNEYWRVFLYEIK